MFVRIQKNIFNKMYIFKDKMYIKNVIFKNMVNKLDCKPYIIVER